jgi:lipopolysaccharide transport system ATP-binding protein
MSDTNIAIKVKNISKCYQLYERPSDRLKQMYFGSRKRLYKEFWALKDVSFNLKKGEIVGIVGVNGSGKSTLLQIISGTLAPSSGNVKTSGRVVALLELGSGFNPEFTGRENVYFNAKLLGLSNEEIDDRFEDIVAFADIGDFINQPVKNYSSGMYVRLAFSVYAMVDPDVFVVDEALAVGDERFQRKCFAKIQELKRKGVAILFVSHSAPMIIELCDKALLLDHGHLIMADSPTNVIRFYQQLLYAPDSDFSNDHKANNKARSNAIKLYKRPDAESQSYFDPGLIPSTTTSYPSCGGKITSFTIKDRFGKEVNLLQPGEIYSFHILGFIRNSFKGLYFGVHIKNVIGAELTGQRFPEQGKFVEHVSQSTEFEFVSSFRMDLLPGVYFVGGGIWSSEDSTCVHRIIDALMFRVVLVRPQNSFGVVNLSSSEPVFILKNQSLKITS